MMYVALFLPFFRLLLPTKDHGNKTKKRMKSPSRILNCHFLCSTSLNSCIFYRFCRFWHIEVTAFYRMGLFCEPKEDKRNTDKGLKAVLSAIHKPCVVCQEMG